MLRTLAKLTEHTLKALGQLNVANRSQCIDDDIEFSRADYQVDVIVIDVEQLAAAITGVFRCHSGLELSRRAIRAKLSCSQRAVAIEKDSAAKSTRVARKLQSLRRFREVHSS